MPVSRAAWRECMVRYIQVGLGLIEVRMRVRNHLRPLQDSGEISRRVAYHDQAYRRRDPLCRGNINLEGQVNQHTKLRGKSMAIARVFGNDQVDLFPLHNVSHHMMRVEV